MRMLMLMLYRGRLIPVPSPETALEFLANEGVARGDVAGGAADHCGNAAKRFAR